MSIIPFPRTRRSRVVAITGGKGGVGRSTVAVNLAALCAQSGSRTLLLDGDFGMADLNLLLGVAPPASLLEVVHGCPINQVLVEAHGIHLLPARNGSYELANLGRQAREPLMAQVEMLARLFDVLVIDTAAGIGEVSLSLAGAAADVVVVANPEPLSLADAYACLKVLASRFGTTRALVLPNAVHADSDADEVMGRLQALVDRFLGRGIELIALPAVPWDRTVPVAAASGIPLVLHSPEAPAAVALRRVAERIDSFDIAGESTDAARSRLFPIGKDKGVA